MGSYSPRDQRSAPGGGQQGHERGLSVRTAPARGLPFPITELVGRDAAVADVAPAFERARLVTLTGAPGVGKTRLAVAVTSAIADSFAEGALWIPLDDVSAPCAIPDALATRIGVCSTPGKVTHALVDHLRERHMLLVLDTCEHVASVCSDLVLQLLEQCPAVSIMATSRQPLAVPGEQVWRVPPLSIPAKDDPDTLESSHAVQVFCQRAGTITRSFKLDRRTGPVVGEICRRLEGAPLAIELAAGRLDALSPQEIMARLDDRLVLLTAPGTTQPARHHSLRAALDWSYELLTDPERSMLRRLSVFSGGCTLAAVEGVCGVDGSTESAPLETLTALVAKSLVAADTNLDETRYQVSENVHHYAAERLTESGELTSVRLAHLTWCAGLAERATAGTAVDERAFTSLEPEYKNLAAALDWAVSHQEAKLALRLTAALVPLWEQRGWFNTSRERFEAILAAGKREADDATGRGITVALDGDRAAGVRVAREFLSLASTAHPSLMPWLYQLAFLAARVDPFATVRLFEEAMTQARDEGEDLALRTVLRVYGTALLLVGDGARARNLFMEYIESVQCAGGGDEVYPQQLDLGRAEVAIGDLDSAGDHLHGGLVKAREAGDLKMVAVALGLLGDLARLQGRLSEARSYLEEGAALARSGLDAFSLALCLVPLGHVALREGDFANASACLQEAYSATQRAELHWLGARSLHGLAELARATGDLREARSLFTNALAAGRQHVNIAVVASSLHGLAELALTEGRMTRAASLHHEALRLRHQICDRVGIVDSIEACAVLEAGRGHWSEVGHLLGAANSLKETLGLAPDGAASSEMAQLAAAARKELGADAFDAAQRLGSAMDYAISYASKGRGSRRRPPTGQPSLTPAERRVAELVGQGLTNREVGELLFVSARTVQNHLAKVFIKLEVTSRRELRAVIAGDGPESDAGTVGGVSGTKSLI